ncbi:hypothetical protein, partial [Saccharothrix sp. ST-888]|uniref:hypothetical protein n=1 Tax=Saccharothrix sp. ST-888 TaxID=1427391 RepID=UPI0005EC4290
MALPALAASVRVSSTVALPVGVAVALPPALALRRYGTSARNAEVGPSGLVEQLGQLAQSL